MTDEALEQQPGGAVADPGPDGLAPADDPASAGRARRRGVEALRDERDRFYDLLLRKTAEFDNYRKRIERERREHDRPRRRRPPARPAAVLDDLERALKVDAGGDEAEAYRKGVELIQRRLLDVLKRRGVTPVDASARTSIPHLHQAVTYEPAEGTPRRRGHRGIPPRAT